MRIPPAVAAISLPHHLWNSASELAMLPDGLDLSSVKRDIVAYLKSLRPEVTMTTCHWGPSGNRSGDKADAPRGWKEIIVSTFG